MPELTSHRDVSELDARVRVETCDEPDPGQPHCRFQFSVFNAAGWVKLTRLDLHAGPLAERLPDGTVRRRMVNGASPAAVLAALACHFEGKDEPIAAMYMRKAMAALKES